MFADVSAAANVLAALECAIQQLPLSPAVVIKFDSCRPAKSKLINLLVGQIGGVSDDASSIIPGDVARICDAEIVQWLAEQPTPVAELLLSGNCSKACLLALSTESHECSCPCAGRYHAALATAEVPCVSR
jgi:hypothetical protein